MDLPKGRSDHVIHLSILITRDGTSADYTSISPGNSPVGIPHHRPWIQLLPGGKFLLATTESKDLSRGAVYQPALCGKRCNPLDQNPRENER